MRINRAQRKIFPLFIRKKSPADYLCRMEILDGRLTAKKIQEDIALTVVQRKNRGLRPPHLAAILVGNNGASETYVASKVKTCQEIGFRSSLHRLPEDISEFQLLDLIDTLNADTEVDGILIQLPLPSHISEHKIINAVDPRKDVDGFHPINVGLMTLGKDCYLPATPKGIMMMLDHYGIKTSGKHAVVIGRSNIVGRPMSILLSNNSQPGNCTVTLCHSRTTNLKEICLQADILVAALGKPEFVTADMVKDGAIVIDVGITRIPDPSKKRGYRIAGDVKFDEVAPKTSYITPVPGGVGPMTICALMKNTLQACENNN